MFVITNHNNEMIKLMHEDPENIGIFGAILILAVFLTALFFVMWYNICIEKLHTNQQEVNTMKIDELIKELEKIKEEHGNLDVRVFQRYDGRDGSYWDDDLEFMIDDEKHYVAL